VTGFPRRESITDDCAATLPRTFERRLGRAAKLVGVMVEAWRISAEKRPMLAARVSVPKDRARASSERRLTRDHARLMEQL
jgi:hypothetical protein